MKIAIIIGIMKYFTSFPLPLQTYDIPALRVIIPTLWGALPHVLGKRVDAAARDARVGGAFRHAGARSKQGANHP